MAPEGFLPAEDQVGPSVGKVPLLGRQVAAESGFQELNKNQDMGWPYLRRTFPGGTLRLNKLKNRKRKGAGEQSMPPSPGCSKRESTKVQHSHTYKQLNSLQFP